MLATPYEKTFDAWRKMRRKYPHLVCRRWSSFDAFVEDMGIKPPFMALVRLDRTKGFEPQNAMWNVPKAPFAWQ